MINKSKCRTVVLISGSGSNLQALIDGQQQGKLPINICAVISNRTDAYGLVRATAAGIANDTVKQRRSKAIDMRFCWIRDRVRQGQFKIHWKRGKDNRADHFTKHHPASHHREMRPIHFHEQQANMLMGSSMIDHCEGVLICDRS